MLALLAVLVLALSGAVAFGLRLWRPRRGYAWLAAATGSLAAWGLALAAGLAPAASLPFIDWQPQALLPDNPALALDLPAWSLLFAILTLNLAAVFAGVHPGPGGDAAEDSIARGGLKLAAGLFLSAAAGLAVLAASLLALALLWSLVDLVCLLVWLAQARDRRQSESAVIAFSIRLFADSMVVWAGLVNSASAHPTALTTLTPQTAAILLAAASVRLGLLPPHRPLPIQPAYAFLAPRRSSAAGPDAPAAPRQTPGLAAILWLSGSAPGWIVLVRAAQAGIPDYAPAFLLLALIAGVYAGLSWLAATAARSPRLEPAALWALGVSALALAAAARGQEFAALAWSTAGLLTGGLAALAVVRPPRLAPALLTGALWFSALPFTPAWPGVALYGAPLNPLAIAALAIQALLLIGYVRLALRPTGSGAIAERWIWLFYPLGLALLPLGHAWIAWQWRPGAGFDAWPGWIESGLAVVGLGLALTLAGVLVRLRGRRWIDEQLARRSASLFELAGLYRLAWWLYRRGMRLVSFLSWALEGRAGLLWALLALALLLSLLAQIGSESS